MILHQQNNTSKKWPILMTDTSDHIAGKTGLTLTVTRSKNGGSRASATGSAAEDSTGTYWFTPSAADVDTLGITSFKFTAAGADPKEFHVLVVPFDPSDPYRGFAGSALPGSVASGSSGLASASDTWAYARRTLTAASPTAAQLQQYENRLIIRGNTYSATARDLSYQMNGVDWMTDLSLWTWTLWSQRHPGNEASGADTITATVSVVTATGDSRALRVSITSTNTSALAKGMYEYALRGTKAGEIWDVVKGLYTVED